MNKAFVREPDATNSYCPRCGSLGQPVLPETWHAQTRPEVWSQVSEAASFCSHATCDVAYFDDMERSISVSDLVRPVYPKDPDAPICPCFGVTCEVLEEDARAGVVTRVRDLVARANSTEARCATMSPTGRPCVAEVQRHYLRARNG